MEFTEEVYHTAFDKALWYADEVSFELMKKGSKDDPRLSDKYRAACRKIYQISNRWEREGYGDLHGSLIDNWFKRVRDST